MIFFTIGRILIFFLGPNRTEVLSFRVCCEIYLCSKQGRFPEGSPELDRSSGHSALLPRLHTEGNEGHPGGREGGEGPQARQSYEDSQSIQSKLLTKPVSPLVAKLRREPSTLQL